MAVVGWNKLALFQIDLTGRHTALPCFQTCVKLFRSSLFGADQHFSNKTPTGIFSATLVSQKRLAKASAQSPPHYSSKQQS